ncbi:MAG TPA: PKD domain-containing protein [Thermoanaerobaculia bacterium]|jgi:PKD repeat protein|nr:PKD domain-containing protein [Thermoanaerobaculia bacterium]
MYIVLSRVSTLARLRLVSAFLIVVLGLILGPATARAFDPAKSPATPAPSSRWTGGALKPGAILGDSTAFAFQRDPRQTEPFYFGLDVENGWVFAVTGRGLQIFDATGSGAPVLVGYGYGPNPSTQGSGGLMPIWFQSDEDWFLEDVDAPPGNDQMVAVAGLAQGFSVWNTSVKTTPTVHYQDQGVAATAVYSANLGNKSYAFAMSSTGVFVYDLTVAQTKSKCLDNSGAGGSLPCSGVFKGRAGAIPGAGGIHGVGDFVAVSRNQLGFEVWNVSTPTTPFKVMNGGGPASGITMWQSGSSYYVATGYFGKVRIYDVSCITSGSCGAPVVLTTLDAPNGVPSLSRVTASKTSGGVPYLYVSGADTSSCPTQPPQREYLFNVSDPAHPTDITPKVDPVNGYWGWYYESCATGFNWVSPQMGKFYGNNFFRAAYSLLDVHQLAAAQPPTANFTWSPLTDIYPGTQVQFLDQSVGSPAPDQWSWTFTDASAATSTAKNPLVSFNSPGVKTVTLTSHNSQGNSLQVSKTVTVIDPTPQVAGITVSPANPVACQPITFTANGVTGRQVLSYSWAIPDAVPAPSPTNVNPLVWNTTASTTPATYTATVTVSNEQGRVSKSVNVTVGALQAINPIFIPTRDAFSAGTVTFHDNQPAGSATEWSWDFDDDGNATTTIWGPWTSDPVNGPAPTHTYTTTGIKTVRVRVRNCTTPDQTNGIASGPLVVPIIQITPLKALFIISGNVLCTGGACFVDAGQAVSFSDQSTGAELWDYDWNGDGSFEDAGNTTPRTTHTFTAQGTFTPKLRVRRGASEQNVFALSSVIAVGPATPGTISVSGPSTGSPNQALSFSASGGGSCNPNANGWSWSASSGTFTGGSNSASATITWAADGTKSITVTNSACTGVSGAKTVTISTVTTPPPPPPPPPTTLQAAFTFTPASPTANQAVSFNGSSSTGSPTSYTWDFGDGGALGIGALATHTYAQAGTYSVQLTVSKPGSCSPAPFCADTATKSVVVTGGGGTNPPPPPPPPGPEFTVSPAAPRATEVVTFDASSSPNLVAGSIFGWNFGDGSDPSLSLGPILHAFAQAGTYNVVLSIAPPGCSNASCLALAFKTVVVGPPPPLTVDFSADVTCDNQLGFESCAAQAGTAVQLTASPANADSYAWSFGDGTTGSGSQVLHAWAQAASYTVTLTATKGSAAASKTRTFVISSPPPPPAPKTKTALLPWVSQSRGPLVQSNDLYLYNPGSVPLAVTLEFRKRGTPDVNPPRVPATIQPGATLYAPDVLRGVFSLENVAGFIQVETGIDSAEPVITAFNSQGTTASKLFGLTIPGSSMNSTGSAAASGPASSQFLVGLNDTPDRQSSFGFSNPTDETATYHLQFYDKTGRLLTESQDLTLSGHDQRQFTVQEIRDSFGINNIDDYRVEVKKVSGAQVFPFGTDVRLVTGDPSFTGPGSYASSRLYLLGVFTGAGAAKSTWQTDLLLSNVSDQVLQTTLTFTAVSNKASVKASHVTVQPGSTERLENALFSQFGLRNGTGVLTLTSTSPNGIFPISRAESYDNTHPTKRYGQSLIALSDSDAAVATKKEVLVGLRQDGANKTTLWILNPSGAAGTYDVVYRGLNGAVLGTLPNIKIGAGQLRQIAPTQHPLKKAGVPGGFTVEVVVKSGKALAAAQVVRTATNDPAFVLGVAR